MSLDSYFVHGFRYFLILAVVSTAVGWIIWLSVEKKIERYNQNHPEHAVSIHFVAAAVRFADFLFWFLTVARQVNPLKPAVDMILSAGGVLALCSTLAAKDSLNNYISGFLLSIHKPFLIGDRIMISMIGQRIIGTVEDITFRHTVIRTKNGSTVTVPNSVMNSTSIENLQDAEKAI
ncbi:MAG: mechanosensitive ion channel family protein [Clostridiales bacterium]|nr:mechanosensitive ion channel family protein [Clostridiales bacterium]